MNLKTLASEAPFERCAAGLPGWFADNINTHCLASSGSTVAFGTSAGELFASRNEGRNWTRVADGLPSVRCVSFG